MGGPGLISGGASYSIKLSFWGECNGPVIGSIRENPDPTPMFHEALPQNEVARGSSL